LNTQRQVDGKVDGKVLKRCRKTEISLGIPIGRFNPVLQLRTTKVNKFNISGTRFFGKNLTTDLKPDGQKEFKNGVFILFPRLFGCAKFLSKIFGLYKLKYALISGLRLPTN
jgi:hypothetical protein